MHWRHAVCGCSGALRAVALRLPSGGPHRRRGAGALWPALGALRRWTDTETSVDCGERERPGRGRREGDAAPARRESQE